MQIDTYLYIHTYIHTYTYIHIHIYIHTHTHMYIHTHTHTYIHTLNEWLATPDYSYACTCLISGLSYPDMRLLLSTNMFMDKTTQDH